MVNAPFVVTRKTLPKPFAPSREAVPKKLPSAAATSFPWGWLPLVALKAVRAVIPPLVEKRYTVPSPFAPPRKVVP